jgi:hypothetical protein
MIAAPRFGRPGRRLRPHGDTPHPPAPQGTAPMKKARTERAWQSWQRQVVDGLSHHLVKPLI